MEDGTWKMAGVKEGSGDEDEGRMTEDERGSMPNVKNG